MEGKECLIKTLAKETILHGYDRNNENEKMYLNLKYYETLHDIKASDFKQHTSL